MNLSDHQHMPTGHSSQTTLKGNAFRPYEDRWPADTRLARPARAERPTLTKAAGRMLRHWPSKSVHAQLVRRAA